MFSISFCSIFFSFPFSPLVRSFSLLLVFVFTLSLSLFALLTCCTVFLCFRSFSLYFLFDGCFIVYDCCCFIIYSDFLYKFHVYYFVCSFISFHSILFHVMICPSLCFLFCCYMFLSSRLCSLLSVLFFSVIVVSFLL